MEWYQAGGLMLGMVLAMMALGTHVAYAFMIANMVGVVVFMGGLIGIEGRDRGCGCIGRPAIPVVCRRGG